MNFNFGEVLTRAWQIIWKYKVLWVFGILASCGQGGGGGNNTRWQESGNNGFGGGPDLPPQMMEWAQWIEQNVTTFIAITLAIICVIWIVVMFLSTIGKIGLIRGTAQAEAGAETLVFGQLFSESMPYFWRMFLLSLILALPVFLIGAGIAIMVLMGVLAASTGGDAGVFTALGTIPLAIACACLLVPIMLVLSLIFRQAERALVLEELEVIPALSRGWEVFKSNLGPIILMAIILGVLSFVLGLVIVIPVFAIVFPSMFAFMMGGGENMTPLILAGICFCLYIPVAWLLQGILTSYTESAWTLTFMRLTGNTPSDSLPQPDDNRPMGTPDNAQTLISTEPLESKSSPAEPKDSDKTIIARKPDA